MSSATTLDHLADAILEVFHFNSDHLYYFSYNDWRGVPIKIYHQSVSEADHFADDYTIASLNLGVGQPLTFLFDFGDEWEFKLRLEQRNPSDSKIQYPTLLQSGGAPIPEQYPME